MKVSKRQLKYIINNYLNEAPEDKGLSDLSNLPEDENKDMTPDLKSIGTGDLGKNNIVNSIKDLWTDAKKNPGDYHFPVYAFARYLGGESSDFTEEELAKTKNGSKYIAELTRILDTAALPFDGSYENGVKKNGYAMKYKGKDVSFYVVDYQVFLGQSGKDNIGNAWFFALSDKGDLSQHLGVTIGQAGVGGKQIAQSGITEDALLRPDLQNGEHRLVNEFDFTRLAPSEAKDMTFGEVFSFYLKDFKDHLGKGASATLSYLAGRTLNSLVDVVADVTPFKYDLVLKSNMSSYPDVSEYPFPKSAESFIDGKTVDYATDQDTSPVDKTPSDKRPIDRDPYADASPGAFF